jgi:hypothetical protein
MKKGWVLIISFVVAVVFMTGQPITLYGKNLKGVPKLACVTGALYGPGQYLAYPGQVGIVNQRNIVVGIWSEVFDIFEATGPAPEFDKWWGLVCKDDWVNTGCSQANYGDADIGFPGSPSGPSECLSPQPYDIDLRQIYNGCVVDDEEFCNMVIFTTCCKIVVVSE